MGTDVLGTHGSWMQVPKRVLRMTAEAGVRIATSVVSTIRQPGPSEHCDPICEELDWRKRADIMMSRGRAAVPGLWRR